MNVEIVCVISNKPEALGLLRAKNHNIATHCVAHKGYPTREEFDREVSRLLESYQVDIVCLAGFMRILSGSFISHYEKKILNIHPALLPSFKGLHAQRQAVEAGVKIAGCTVHFVEPDMDSGPIIAQTAVPVYDYDTEDTLAARILEVEHPTFVKAVSLFCDDKLSIQGRIVTCSQTKGANL